MKKAPEFTFNDCPFTPGFGAHLPSLQTGSGNNG